MVSGGAFLAIDTHHTGRASKRLKAEPAIGALCYAGAAFEGWIHMHKLVFFAYATLVTVLSLTPSGGPGIAHLDKLMHFLVYYLFAVFGYRMLNTGRYDWALGLGIIAFSGLLEVAQANLPGRVMSGYDLIANTLGVVAGAMVVTRKRKAQDCR
jgi:VanZ family protein